MMASVLTALLVILLLESGTWAFQWTANSIPSGSTRTVCNGQHSVDLVWGYNDDASEHDIDFVWMFKTGEHSDEILLASVYRGHFFTEPNIRQHLIFLPPSGLRITDLTSQDYGIYTIKVNVNQFGSIVTHNSTVQFQISEPFALSHDTLHISRMHDVIYDNDTNEYRAQLACGTFTSLGNPPVEIVFRTPSHEVLNDTTYENGHFIVAIPNPAADGDYTCQIANPQDTCLPANSTLLAPATARIAGCNVQLDVAAAELSAMKAHQHADVQHEVQRLRDEISSLQTANRALGVELQHERQARNECAQQLLQHTEPQHTEPQHTEPHHTEPQHTEPHHTEPHHTEPHHTEPHHTEPHHTEDSTPSYNSLTCSYGRSCDFLSSGSYTHDPYHTRDPESTTSMDVSPWPWLSYSHQLEVRLVGGAQCNEGRLEVRVYGCSQWGTVCDDRWDQNAALVVCRQLGFTGVTNYLTTSFGPGTGPILLDDIDCYSYESELGQCYNPNVIGHHNCQHSEDVGLICASGKDHSRTSPGYSLESLLHSARTSPDYSLQSLLHSARTSPGYSLESLLHSARTLP